MINKEEMIKSDSSMMCYQIQKIVFGGQEIPLILGLHIWNEWTFSEMEFKPMVVAGQNVPYKKSTKVVDTKIQIDSGEIVKDLGLLEKGEMEIYLKMVGADVLKLSARNVRLNPVIKTECVTPPFFKQYSFFIEDPMITSPFKWEVLKQ